MITTIPNELKTIKELVYEPCGFEFTQLSIHPESKEYGACFFALNGQKIEYRRAKITPAKTGQFVAIWKRNAAGITAPFDTNDNISFIIITVKNGEQLGQFIFPKAVLEARKIISFRGTGGKRGIRVYPPWDKTTSKQAEKTQKWQLNYFLPVKGTSAVSLSLAKQLLAGTV